MVGTVVQRELVGMPVDREVPAGDAVTVAPDHGAEESRLGEIVFQVVVTDDDIAQPPLPIGNAD